MTAGDIYSDYDVSTGTGGTNIIPAGTTKVLITAIYTDDASNGRFTLQMNEVYASPGIGDNPSSTNNFGQWNHAFNTKFFVNNSHFFGFKSNSGSIFCGYSGIEI